MKKFNTLLLILITLGLSFQLQAQDRYLDEVFTDVQVTTDVIYGVNATVLLQPVVGEAVPQPLLMDVYEPVGDTIDDRPLVIYFPTGQFLPFPQNQTTGGTRKDSSNVEICTRLAKMGYVAAVAEYRVGWNPIAPTQDERVFTLINAAYRGIQDARTCIRYFRRQAEELGNMYGVDTDKIVLFGQGTGGYLPLNTAVLDSYLKIATTPKFVTQDSMGNPIPMVLESVNGDIYGTSVGIVPPGYPVFPTGDTLCYPNHVGYSSDFHMSVNLGGAMGDTSWLDPGHVPMVSLAVPTDPFAPYMEALVIVPGPNLPVVVAQGSYLVQKLANEFGNNDCFASFEFDDPVSQVANTKNDGYDGLFPLIGTIDADSAPWEWWDTMANPNSDNGLMTNPDMSAEKAKRYIDTIMAYYSPRAYVCLDLGDAITNVPILEDELTNLVVHPNPAHSEVFFATNKDYEIRHIELFDMSGRMVNRINEINNNYALVRRGNLESGIYVAKVHFDEGIMSRKIVFK